MASGRVRLSALERDSVAPPNLARSLSTMVWQLDKPTAPAVREIQGRLALIAGRVDRVALEDEPDQHAVVVLLDGVRLNPTELRAQLSWLMGLNGVPEADRLACLVEALLQRAELTR